jgi:hypothetical protein
MDAHDGRMHAIELVTRIEQVCLITTHFVTPILSGQYGARTLSATVYSLPCIKIGDKKIMKKTLNFFRLLLGGPSSHPVSYLSL